MEARYRSSKNKSTQANCKSIIVLMTKWHAINRCKSRLSKEIGPIKAAKIQEKLTNHTIAVANEIQEKGLAEVKIAIDGIGLKAAKKWARQKNIEKVSTQGTGNLGIKIRRQFLKTYYENNRSVKNTSSILIIGSDLPSISYADLAEALEILRHKEMILGPSNDGGYWLLGLSKKLLNPLCLWPFCGIEWGTKEVLKKTIKLASLNQIDYELLENKNDLDSLIDLSPWLDYKKFQLSASSYQL